MALVTNQLLSSRKKPVLLHAAVAILLFLLLWRMTGLLWRSAFVAWVAERKDVLSGLFFTLTLWAYVSYSRRSFSTIRYLTVTVLFALGLMAKPMLVTLPFVLLLLDYWPLGRLGLSVGREAFPVFLACDRGETSSTVANSRFLRGNISRPG